MIGNGSSAPAGCCLAEVNHAQTVEPVFGQIKSCMKMTAMSRRGFSACRNEWLLTATAHNLRKLHAHHRSG